MNTDALVDAILHPEKSSSSSDKTFPEVAKDARSRMDEKYQQMKDGDPFDSKKHKDIYSLLGDLDRRSLYAVSSNEGGFFTEEERRAEAYVMRQQQNMATGIYSGPAEFELQFMDNFDDDVIGNVWAGVNFLNSLSEEEKRSAEWQSQRANLRRRYQKRTSRRRLRNVTSF